MTVQPLQPAARTRRPAARPTPAAVPDPQAGAAPLDLGTDAPAVAVPDLEPLDTIELVTGQGQQGTGFSFKVQATGALFRCQVMRCPNQPRFWCITVYLCLDGGSPDKDQPRWIGTELLTREEMPEALAAVQSNVIGWLSEPSRADLRAWVLAQTSRSPMASNPRFAAASLS